MSIAGAFNSGVLSSIIAGLYSGGGTTPCKGGTITPLGKELWPGVKPWVMLSDECTKDVFNDRIRGYIPDE